LENLGIGEATFVVGLNDSASYLRQIADVLRPEGKFALIDDPASLDIRPFKSKSISIHWELMFTRPIFGPSTLARQHALLRRVAELVDRGDLKHTLTRRVDGIDAASLKQAHAWVEAGDMIGKAVLVAG
jgi:NADPH:quinone reductase-like Zn-dependent oxidoreductase